MRIVLPEPKSEPIGPIISWGPNSPINGYGVAFGGVALYVDPTKESKELLDKLIAQLSWIRDQIAKEGGAP